ncbi:MAG: TetR/AcrR family transcriptional regulator [Ktedonobacteraceae bacterium]|nr:TetR/AcrR family transcriptional regulator [Ktedonobacteraceae bacterium]
MARTVKPEAFAAKRREILEAAYRQIFTKGYERMSIQDILNDIQISSGAFHHYFNSRNALLEAIIEYIRQETEKPLLPILHDPHLTAIAKLQGFFDMLDRLRIAHKADVARLGRVWYSDDNALIRLKVDEAIFQQRAPVLSEIVRQGVREGTFTTAYPEKAGEVIMSLLQGMGNIHARLLLSATQERDNPRRIEEIVKEVVTIHAVYMDAIERLLGAPSHSFYRTDAETVKVWVTAIQED